LFDAEELAGFDSCCVLHAVVDLRVDQLEGGFRVVHLILVDALLMAVGARDSTQCGHVGLMELVVVFTLLWVRFVIGEVSILVGFTILVRVVDIAEEVKEVGQFLLDVFEQFGSVHVSAGIGDASGVFSDVRTIDVRILFLQFSEMVDTPFRIGP